MSNNALLVRIESFNKIIDELGVLNTAMESQGEELKRLANLLKVLQSKTEDEYFSEQEYKDVRKIYDALGSFCSETLHLQRQLRDERDEILRKFKRRSE